MQEIIINEIKNTVVSLMDNVKKQENYSDRIKIIVKLYQLIDNFKKVFPEKAIVEYIEFFNSLEMFLEKCGNDIFLNNNKEMMLSSLELMIECMEEINKYFGKHAKKCACCNTKGLYLPLPSEYEQMQRKYGMSQFGIDETLNKDEYLCPTCLASDRDRMIVSFLKKEELQKASEDFRILQIAPAVSISKWIEINCPQVKYETTDLFMDGVTFKSDIQNMENIQDATYDLIICSHVLEHVQNDKKALREIKRVLKQDGKCVFLVPTILGYDEIDEEWGLTQEENWRRFGQGDHCRKYGKKALVERLEECFHVIQLGKEYFGEEIFKQQGLQETSNLYVLTKDDGVSLNMAEQNNIDPDLIENGPLVSVIMCCYNHGKYVEQAILSVLNQTYKNIEFRVADDGSSDNSAQIMKKYSQYYAYEYYSEENTGELWSAVRKDAQGKYIALMNSDDLWEKDKIALQVAYMEKHPDCGVCVTWCKYISDSGEELDDNLFIKGNRDSFQWMNYFWKHGNALCNPSYLATREYEFQKIRFGAACRQLPDFFKWVQIVQETSIYVMPKVLVKMRRHSAEFGENVSLTTTENIMRHIMEEGCNWMWIIRQMDKAFFKKSFSDMMINPDAETDEEIKCEKFFLLNSSKNISVQYEAICYLNEIYVDVEACLRDEYHYDYRNVAKDIVNRGFGALFLKNQKET